MKQKTRGFTLIELLVVVAIIGILSSVVLASLSTSRVKARDSRRIADLDQIRTALELFQDSYGFYPPTRTADTCGGYRNDIATSLCTDPLWMTTDTNFNGFMQRIPRDPLNKPGTTPGGALTDAPWWSVNTNVYAYYASSTLNTYDLLTNLENTTNNLRCDAMLWKSRAYVPDSGCWTGSFVIGGVLFRGKQIYSVQ